MTELLDSLLTMLGDLFTFILPWLLGAAVIGAIACVGLAQLTKLYKRWREGESFWKFQPRYLYKAKAMLLANKVLREMYEPSDQHIVELEEGQRPGLPLAWLHPYPKAIRSTIKYNRGKTRGGKKKLEASRQIRELAEWIKVEKMPSFVFFAGSEKEHFAVKLIYNGEKTQDEMEKLAQIVKPALSAHSVNVLQTKNASTLTLAVHLKEPENPLVEHGKDHNWLDENPAKTPKSLPIAITGDGETAWNYPMRHTVVLGQTGGGKGSVMHAIIRQLAKFVLDGSVVLHGIDGKAWEMRPYKQVPGLFKEVAFEADEMAELIFDLKEQMEARARSMKIDVENRKAEMTVEPTPAHPWHILVIDELWDVFNELGGLKHPAYDALNSIGRKGRALGFWIVAFTQTVEISEIGNLRKHFVNKIALAQDSAGFNEYMLGKEAAERGFDSTAIPAGDKYAGIGFVKGQTGDPELVRFAYSHGDEVVTIAAETQEALAAKGNKKLSAPAAQPKRETPGEEPPALEAFQW